MHNPLMKCQVKVKTATGSYHYTGLFRSTWYAMMDAAKRIGEPCRVTVEVVK